MQSEDISFSVPILEAAVIDKAKGIYQLTLIKEGLTDDRRREYPASVLQKAVGLFEGSQAFADHPTKSEMKDRPERSMRDLVGIYEGVQVVRDHEGTKLKANLKTLESAAWMRPILDMAIENPTLCGASIHADGCIQPKAGSGGSDLVESIESVFSTDIVTKPNAGGRVERLIASQRDDKETLGGERELEFKNITLEELTKERPDLLESVKETFKKEAEDKTKVSIDKTEHEALKEAVKKVEELTVQTKIAESKILETVKDKEDKEKIEEDLKAAMLGKTDEDMDKVLESRKLFLKGIGAKIIGNPAKESQRDKGKAYHIGTLLGEAKGAYAKLVLKESA